MLRACLRTAPTAARSLAPVAQPLHAQARGFNLPRPNIFPEWDKAVTKGEYLANYASPLNVKVQALGVDTDVTGKGAVRVNNEVTSEFDVSASTEHPGTDFMRALVANLVWATQRAWKFNNSKLNGVKVVAPEGWKGENVKLTVHYASDDSSPELQAAAKNSATLLHAVGDHFQVEFKQDPSVSGNLPAVKDDFLARGLTALLACQQKFFMQAAHEQGINVRGIEFDAEMDVDTRGFVYGASTAGVSPRARDVYFRARVNTNATLDEVKHCGQAAQSKCKILGGFSKNRTNIATRWTKS